MKRLVPTLALVGMLGVMVAAPAAADTLEFEIREKGSGPVGSTVALATVDVPDDLIGQACVVTVETLNLSSTHPDNELVLTSNGDAITLDDVEREGGWNGTASAPITLGETIVPTLTFGPDGEFSLWLTFSLDCAPVETTTTTVPETTTTTVVETTTTTVPETTTTTVVETTTTTVPQTTTSTIPETTTTTQPTETSVPDEPPPTMTVPPQTPNSPPPELPYTGLETWQVLLAAIVLVGGGGVALYRTQGQGDSI